MTATTLLERVEESVRRPVPDDNLKTSALVPVEIKPAEPGELLDPNTAGENAAHAVHKCLQAAEHIRHMGEQFLAIAQTVKATGDALALDIENRAANFDAMMASAREYAQLTHGVFAQERERLNGGLNLSGSGNRN